MGLSWAVFGAISSDPFWHHFGTVFRLSWAILKPSWGHLRSKRLLERAGAKDNFGQTDFWSKSVKNPRFFKRFS